VELNATGTIFARRHADAEKHQQHGHADARRQRGQHDAEQQEHSANQQRI